MFPFEIEAQSLFWWGGEKGGGEGGSKHRRHKGEQAHRSGSPTFIIFYNSCSAENLCGKWREEVALTFYVVRTSLQARHRLAAVLAPLRLAI